MSNAATPRSPVHERGSRRPRDIAERVEFEAEIELTSPAHFGGTDADASTDRPVVRDAKGIPYIPGTSLAGVARSINASMLNDVAALEAKQAVEVLFGSEATDDANQSAHQSRLLFSDAELVPEADDKGRARAPGTEFRDGVAIDPARGIAANRLKYDAEFVPAGTRFRFRMELILPEKDRSRVAAAMAVLLAELAEHGFRVGARTSRGFGHAKLRDERWGVTRHDMSKPDCVRAWLMSRVGGASATAQRWAADDFAKAFGVSVAAPTGSRAIRHRMTLEVEGTLLIRSPGRSGDDADNAHLTRRTARGAVEHVISGTSLAGVLRSRCLKIANTLAGASGRDRAARLVNGMFGPRPEDRAAKRGASRVRVDEAVVTSGTVLRHGRARIDPWTGGAADHLLFHEDALFGGEVRGLEVVLLPRRPAELNGKEPASSRPEPAEVGLLLLALRDLATGDLPVGGESGVGRGRLRATKWRVTDCGTERELRVSNGGGVACLDTPGWGQVAIDALVQTLDPQNGAMQ